MGVLILFVFLGLTAFVFWVIVFGVRLLFHQGVDAQKFRNLQAILKEAEATIQFPGSTGNRWEIVYKSNGVTRSHFVEASSEPEAVASYLKTGGSPRGVLEVKKG